MKRTIAFILTAILVLGMIPATVITAFAHGYGVAGNNQENQSIPNALGQSVPETIKVDGVLDDTGWRTDLWNDVDRGSGVWNTSAPDESNKTLNYRYQIRTDYNYFYTSAEISLPAGQKIARYTIFLSDANPQVGEDAERGATGGFIFEIDTTAVDKVSVSPQAGYDEAYFENYADNVPENLQKDEHGWFVYAEDGENKIYYLNKDQVTHNNGRTILSEEGKPGYVNNTESAPSGTVAEYAAYRLEYRLEGSEETGYKVIIEFRNRALDTYNTERTLRYYVSVGVPREKQINANYRYDNLYHPPFSRTANSTGLTGIYPTFENWPGIGAQVNYSESDLDGTGTIPGVITVDGVFDEAVWSGMTDYYTANGAYGNTEYKDDVSADPFGTIVDLSTVGYNEKSDENSNYDGGKEVWPELQFKYDVRADSEYLYGAVYVYARSSKYTSMQMRFFNEDNALTHSMSMYCNSGQKAGYSAALSRANPTTTDGGKNYEYDSTPISKEEWEIAASSNGAYYVYEFKVPLEVVDYDVNNFKYSITQGKEDYKKPVEDNTNKDGVYFSITVGSYDVPAVEGLIANETDFWSSCGIGQDVDAFSKDSDVKIRKKVEKTKYVGNASESVKIDGKLDDAAWTAISGADLKFDYATRQNAKDKTQKYKNLIYNVKADRDYIYGAVYVVLNDGAQWDTTTGTGDTNKSLVRLAITPYQSAITDASGKQTRIISFHLENGQEKCYSHVYDGSTFRSDELTEYGGLGEYVGADVKFNLKGNMVLVEFKINVDDLGLDLGMQSHDENGVYFAYHITAEDSALGGFDNPTGSAISHPAIGSIGGYYEFESDSQMNELYATYSNVVTYGDVLEHVVIDGNIEENLWDNMTHVDESNGIYKTDPYQAILIDYDYSIYVGNKYLYGAAVFDEEITEDTDSRFTIWFDNGVDERTSIPIASDGNNTCEFEFYEWNVTYDTDNKKDISVTELQYFVNHNYSFALYGDQYNGPYGTGMNGRWDDNPEANPDVYLVNGSEVAKENGKHYKYVVKKINGKTYLEFMIDLDTVHCDPTDFRFYVCFEHNIKLTNYAKSELYHPIPQTESEPFWLTHVDPNTTEGLDAAGVIFTDYTKYQTAVNKANNIKYWNQVSLKPNGNGGYTIMEIIYHHGTEATSRHLAKGEGYIYYVINAGSYYEDEDRDARNPRASQAASRVVNWRPNDELILDLDGKTFADHKTITKPIIFYTTSGVDKGKHEHTGNIETTNRYQSSQVLTRYTQLKEWQAGGYYSSYTVTRVQGQQSIEADLHIRNQTMPNFLKYGNSSCWMHSTSGTAQKLSYINPEGVVIDGSLGDSGWKENGWISVSGDVNATDYRASEGVEYKYQLRADHDYLYVAAVLDTAFAKGVSFKLWLKSASGDKYDNLYELAYGETTVGGVKGSVSHELQAASLSEEAASGLGYSEGKLTYPYVINAYKDQGKTALGYGESAVFGYTKELVESSSDGIWVWEAYPTTYGFRYGNEHAVIASGDGVTVNNKTASADQTVVEFKIGIDEFGGENGFEYFIEVSDSNGTTFYPQIFSELESEFNYYDYNYPTFNWDSGRANSVSKADINVNGAMWLVDKYTPVVTLGAKISDNYTASDGTTGHKAIRMGALYTEEYIRKLPHNTNDADKTTDYWDVADVGIIVLPTAYIAAGDKLDHSNEKVRSISAINIVDWISNKETGEGTNFADYENFVFYATIYGVPEGVELSFAAFIDYYNENGTDTYYDHTFVRSYSMVEQLVNENDNLPE